MKLQPDMMKKLIVPTPTHPQKRGAPEEKYKEGLESKKYEGESRCATKITANNKRARRAKIKEGLKVNGMKMGPGMQKEEK